MQSITFNWANNIVVSGLTSINSQFSHLVINSCNNVVVQNVKLIAPDLSPNTDGIHVQTSTGVTIKGSTMQTGDDCISIGPGTNNLLMSNIKCGPGHGVRYVSRYILKINLYKNNNNNNIRYGFYYKIFTNLHSVYALKSNSNLLWLLSRACGVLLS